MKEWDVFTLALLNFHRTPERESAAVENNRTPFRKKFFVSTTTKDSAVYALLEVA